MVASEPTIAPHVTGKAGSVMSAMEGMTSGKAGDIALSLGNYGVGQIPVVGEAIGFAETITDVPGGYAQDYSSDTNQFENLEMIEQEFLQGFLKKSKGSGELLLDPRYSGGSSGTGSILNVQATAFYGEEGTPQDVLMGALESYKSSDERFKDIQINFVD